MKPALDLARRHWLRDAASFAAVAGTWVGIARAAAEAIDGTWLTDDGASKVEIAPTKAADGSAVWEGRVVWLKEPLRDGQPLRDANNADPALRSRPLLGVAVLSGFRPTAGGFGGGSVYSPRAGKTYPAEMALAADGRLQLKVKAGLLTKTVYWTR